MTAATTTATGKMTERTLVERTFSVNGELLLTKIPQPPDDLDDEGVLWWNYYCGIFVDGQILSKMFLTSMHNLCIAHMLRNSYMQELTSSPTGIMLEETYVTRDKELATRRYSNPMVKELRGVLIEMDRLLASLGMTCYTSKVNNIDTSGMVKKAKGAAPPAALPPPPRDPPSS